MRKNPKKSKKSDKNSIRVLLLSGFCAILPQKGAYFKSYLLQPYTANMSRRIIKAPKWEDQGDEMKKLLTVLCVVMFCFLSLASCMKEKLPDLPQDSIAFQMGTFEDTEHEDALFGSIVYNGRVYIPYGTINNAYRKSCIDSCIGYIVQDENSSSVIDPDNTDRRVYTIAGDPERNFLMEYDDTIKLMNQPAFYRAVDSNGKDIAIPNYMDSLDYDYWKNQ